MRVLSVLVAGVLFLCHAFAGEKPKPVNIIFIIGDGMGIQQVTASVLKFKDSPFRLFTTTGFSVTCSADNLITESAAGASAYSIAQRTNNKYIGVNTKKEPVETVMELAEKQGYRTGVVVTSSLTNATPASFISHVPHRSMEYEIARQIRETEWDVLAGGGKKFFNAVDSSSLSDGRTVLQKMSDDGYSYFNDLTSFISSDVKTPVIALCGEEGIPRADERNYTLGQVVKKSLSLLSNGDEPFFLLIEGSQIDWACHVNDEKYLFAELNDFNTAITEAINFAKKDGNTLVVVTADHETGGTAIVDGKSDGSEMKLAFVNKEHTAGMVGVFAFGKYSELFGGIQENYTIGEKLFRLVKGEE